MLQSVRKEQPFGDEALLWRSLKRNWALKFRVTANLEFKQKIVYYSLMLPRRHGEEQLCRKLSQIWLHQKRHSDEYLQATVKYCVWDCVHVRAQVPACACAHVHICTRARVIMCTRVYLHACTSERIYIIIRLYVRAYTLAIRFACW